MVLSNKKLKQKQKQKHRAELLAKRVSESEPDEKNPDSNSEPYSLKSLLDSVTQKPRLSKREKRRKNLPFPNGSNQETGENRMEVEEDVEKGNSKEGEKKRKREEGKGKEGKTTSENKESKKKKKNKNKNKKKKKQKNANEEHEVLQVENGAESQVREDVATKVYVGGIPYSYTEDDIRYYFESCGTITDIDLMKFPDTGKFRGIAIVSFETEVAAKEALALDRAEMGGMQLTIQPYKSTRANKVTGFAPKMVEGYNRIYVGNLSWNITEDDLKKFFSDSNVSSIRLGTDKETGEFRGYAHVDFSDSVSVAMALKLDQEIVCGRPVKISCAVPKKGVQTQSGSHQTTNEVRRGDGRSSSKEPRSVEAPVAVTVEAPTASEVDNGGSSVSSRKLRRRMCYHCRTKGHISSACPSGPASVEALAPNAAPTGNEAPLSIEAATVNEVDNVGFSVSSGKLRRRTCYHCGQKGHISSACPSGPASVEALAPNAAPTGNEAPLSVEAATVNEVDDVGFSVSSGKLRRRTCYECGQKGHISSDCPKNPASTEAPISNEAPLSVEAPTGNESPPVNEVENGVSTISSGKLRRRTCYKCGQKGHISSACPNTKPAETTNANTN